MQKTFGYHLIPDWSKFFKGRGLVHNIGLCNWADRKKRKRIQRFYLCKFTKYVWLPSESIFYKKKLSNDIVGKGRVQIDILFIASGLMLIFLNSMILFKVIKSIVLMNDETLPNGDVD